MLRHATNILASEPPKIIFSHVRCFLASLQYSLVQMASHIKDFLKKSNQIKDTTIKT